MNELLYKEEVFQLIGSCMEIHRELEKATTKSSTKTPLSMNLVALEVHSREQSYKISYKGVILPRSYYADTSL